MVVMPAGGHREIAQVDGALRRPPRIRRKGPKLKGKHEAIAGLEARGAINGAPRDFLNQSQLSGVSSQRMGRPELPEVWWRRQ